MNTTNKDESKLTQRTNKQPLQSRVTFGPNPYVKPVSKMSQESGDCTDPSYLVS